MSVSIDEERMNDFFVKHHIRGLPQAAVFHHFAEADAPWADPHDHAQFGFRSIILTGGYIERVFQRDGSSETIHRQPGDSFRVSPDHIHRIECLPEGEAWTLILPGPHTGRASGFFRWADGRMFYRQWDAPEFAPVA